MEYRYSEKYGSSTVSYQEEMDKHVNKGLILIEKENAMSYKTFMKKMQKETEKSVHGDKWEQQRTPHIWDFMFIKKEQHFMCQLVPNSDPIMSQNIPLSEWWTRQLTTKE